ncbi:MAG TPA: hypothetical protein VFU47_00385, partial [Armatimonadota bacterium]|nr:hypothetical protein [Armatimonadota bacterium]
ENLRKDEAELDRIKAAGVGDLWIDCERGLLQSTPEQTQKILDAVESRGLRYGLRVGDRFREPLIGFSPTLTPLRVPVSKLQPGAGLHFNVSAPGARRLVYNLVENSAPSELDDRQQNWAIASGEVVVEKDNAEVQIQLRQSRLLGKSRGLLHVVPEIQVEPEDLGSFGDLWAGMERYSQRVKAHLQALKFGPGLRFILDPFSAGDGSTGSEDMVFPSSEAFRTAFAEWLKKRGGIQTLNIRWRTTDKRIPGFAEAARTIPMWGRNDPPEGDGWLFDPVDKVAYRCKPAKSGIWQDLDDFRAETLKRWMNVVASSLKQEGLNVPVLFSWSAYHPLFINSPSPSGYDGLGAQLFGSSPGLSQDAAFALAEAEEAARQSWLIATRLSGPRGEDGKVAPLPDVRKAWEELREVGFRGAFLDPESDPNALSMAKELAAAISADSAALQQPLKVCFFPMPLATADRVTRLSSGVWWLPSGSSANLLRYGDSVLGYEIEKPFGEESPVKKGTVLWSAKGAQELSFYVADLITLPEWYDNAGQPLKVKIDKKKRLIRVPVTEEPIVAAGIEPVQLFPVELAAAQLREFDALLREAEAQKLDSSTLRTLYKDAQQSLAPNSAPSIYSSITPYVNRLREELRPYLWLEGEKATSHNFSGITFQAGCSGGTYLRLDRSAPPTSGVYRARYTFDLRRDASYDIWVAGRLPGAIGVSPLIWQIDDEPAVELKGATAVGGSYSAGMTWFNLGRATLKLGRHELTLVIPEKATGGTGRFVAGIDAVVLSRDAFTPSGIEKPSGLARSAK